MSPLVIQIAHPDHALPAEYHAAEPVGAGSAHDQTAVGLVFAHGAGAGHRHPFMRHHAALLAARGLDVLTFDFPYLAAGRKLPDRAPVLEGALRAAAAALLEVTGGRIGALAIAGKSMGGRMATHVAAQPGAWALPVPLVAAVAFGYPLTPPGARGGDRVSHLGRLFVPLLVVQGTRDPFGGPEAVRTATAGMTGITVRAVESGDHSLKVTVASGQRQADVDHGLADEVVAFVRAAADQSRL